MWVFLAYVLIVVLMVNQRRLRRDLEEAAAAVGVLGGRLNAFEWRTVVMEEAVPAAPQPPRTAPEAQPEPEPVPESQAEPESVSEAMYAEPPVEPTRVAPPPVMPPPLPAFLAADPVCEVEPTPSRNWEELIGGNILNKLGALVLVIGIALFLSYSFARMGPMGRALSSLGVSGAILAGGVVLERKETYRVFSRGLIAAGWAGLYFTSYAMYAIDAARIIANPFVGTLLMSAVGGAMVLHTLRYRLESLSALAHGCVFAALALSESSTFVAIALLPLAASMLYLARRFAWNWLALFGAAATYGTFLSRPASGASLLAIQSMLLLFWLLFESFDILRVRAAQGEDRDPLLFGVNALAGLGASAALWYRMAPDAMWQFCVAGSVLYLISTWVRFPLGANSLWEASVTLSVALAALGIFAGVEGLWTSLAYIALAEVVFFASLRVRHVLLRALSLIAFGVAVIEIGSRAVEGNWSVPVAVLGAVFYLNRYLARGSRYFGFFASACVALVLAFEPPMGFAGPAIVLFGFVLFEFGLRRELEDFRLQGYIVAAWGGIETVLAYFDASANAWVIGAGAALTLGQAIRATRWLSTLPDEERRWMRTGAALLTVVLAVPAILTATPQPHWGVALLAASVLLHELAFRNLPAEMLWPASLVHVLATRFALSHASEIAKNPEPVVWLSFGGMALAAYWLGIRLLRDASETRAVQRAVYPWLGGSFTVVTLWMVLPDAWLPLAIGAVALAAAETGLRAASGNLIWHGRAMALVGAASAHVLDLPRTPYVANTIAQSALQWWLWRRVGVQALGVAHGWIAVAGLVWLVPGITASHAVIGWSILGASLAVAARFLVVRDLRWQSAAVAVLAAFAALGDGGDYRVLHLSFVVGWFLLAVMLEPREGQNYLRPAYAIAAAVQGAAALYYGVSGPMLTLGWSLQGIALLAFGFPARERALRMAGLAMLLGCIGKVFLYDLRNLETMYRILSFVGLGAVLIAVSFIYTRFRDQLRRYL